MIKNLLHSDKFAMGVGFAFILMVTVVLYT